MVTGDRLARKDAVGVGASGCVLRKWSTGEGSELLPVVTRLAGADVIDNHVTDFFRAVLLVVLAHPGTAADRAETVVADTVVPRTPKGIFLH